ncbi:hypothetical protein V1509DRAFT_627931 [Lipomyces kononenkoae]
MTDNYTYFVPRSDVYTQPGAIGSGPEYVGTGKSLTEYSMEGILGDSGHQQLHNRMQQQSGGWDSSGYSFNGYPESEDTAMFNTANPSSRPLSRPPSPESIDGFFGGNVVEQQQLSDNGDDMKLNLNDDNMLSKRKAQNRAAQRAFRERREKHVKELEEKLALAEKSAKEIEAENARLKRELDWHQAENKVLKESAQSTRTHDAVANSGHPWKAVFPEVRKGSEEIHHTLPTDLHTTDTIYLNPFEIWDRLKKHPQADALDIKDIMKRLESKAVCGGHGPIFRVTDVDEAIAAQAFAQNE